MTGMTCQHCVRAVTGELTALDSVGDVAVDLAPDGESVVTVTSSSGVSDEAVRSAIESAGYRLTG